MHWNDQNRLKIYTLPQTLFCNDGNILYRYVGSKLEDFKENFEALMAFDERSKEVDAEIHNSGPEDLIQPVDTIISPIPSSFILSRLSVLEFASSTGPFLDFNLLVALGKKHVITIMIMTIVVILL